MLKGFWHLLLILASTGAYAQTIPKLDEVQETAWTQDFFEIYKKSRDSDNLLNNLRSLTALDRQIYRALIGTKMPLPTVKLQHREIIFNTDVTLKLISLNDRTFSINGKRFVYDSQKNLVANLVRIGEAISKKKVSSFSFLLPQAEADPYGEELMTLQEKILLPSSSVEVSVASIYDLVARPLAPGKVASGLSSFVARGSGMAVAARSLAMAAATMATHEISARAEALRAPSCQVQISELKKVLEETHLGLADLNCDHVPDHVDQARNYLKQNSGKSVTQMWSEMAAEDRKNKERTITFWTDKSTKRTFNVSWVDRLAWDNTDRLFIFSEKELKEFRILTTETASKETVLSKYTQGTLEFNKQRAFIEPFRKVFEYIGTNRTCYKCQQEISKELVTKVGPNVTASKTPAVAPSPGLKAKPTR